MSKVVFVGNVPYNMSEDSLIDVFKSVGNVVGFRLVFDRDTGKPRGYGFCEFTDHETALSAVRNLNGTDCGGRPLRIDLADSDPMLEGKTTVRGEIIDAGDHHRHWGQGGRDGKRPDSAFLANLPPGRPLQPGQSATDAITQILATVPQQQMSEVLAQMKAFIINHPDHAKILLNAHPQLSYALFQALLMHNIVDPAVLQRLLPTAPTAPAPQIAAPQMQPVYGQTPGIPPVASYPAAQPIHSVLPPVPSTMTMPGFGGYAPPPPASAVATQPPAINPFYRPPTAPQVPQPSTPVQSVQPAIPAPLPAANYSVNPDQQQMLMQVLSLTAEQIAAMPPTEQETIRMLRAQLGVAT